MTVFRRAQFELMRHLVGPSLAKADRAASAWRRRKRKPRGKAQPPKEAQALDLVVDVAEALLRDRGEAVWGSHVKQVLKRKRPDFDETSFGYRGWGDLLEDAARQGRLEVSRDKGSGGYRITAVPD